MAYLEKMDNQVSKNKLHKIQSHHELNEVFENCLFLCKTTKTFLKTVNSNIIRKLVAATDIK